MTRLLFSIVMTLSRPTAPVVSGLQLIFLRDAGAAEEQRQQNDAD
jgi:hypothetical protein